MSVTVTNEYICEDCGSLFQHSNPVTLQSMKEVHNQLCDVKRQKSSSSEAAKAALTQKVSPPVPSSASKTPQASQMKTPPLTQQTPPTGADSGAAMASVEQAGAKAVSLLVVAAIQPYPLQEVELTIQRWKVLLTLHLRQ